MVADRLGVTTALRVRQAAAQWRFLRQPAGAGVRGHGRRRVLTRGRDGRQRGAGQGEEQHPHAQPRRRRQAARSEDPHPRDSDRMDRRRRAGRGHAEGDPHPQAPPRPSRTAARRTRRSPPDHCERFESTRADSKPSQRVSVGAAGWGSGVHLGRSSSSHHLVVDLLADQLDDLVAQVLVHRLLADERLAASRCTTSGSRRRPRPSRDASTRAAWTSRSRGRRSVPRGAAAAASTRRASSPSAARRSRSAAMWNAHPTPPSKPGRLRKMQASVDEPGGGHAVLLAQHTVRGAFLLELPVPLLQARRRHRRRSARPGRRRSVHRGCSTPRRDGWRRPRSTPMQPSP